LRVLLRSCPVVLRGACCVIVIAAVLAPSRSPAGDGVARSLPDSERLIQAPEGKRAFAGQIHGRKGIDRLGVRLPSGVARDEVLSVVSPALPGSVTLVGAVPWKGRPRHLVAIVCVGGEASQDRSVCEGGAAWVAVLQRTDDGLQLVARTSEPFVPVSDWSAFPDDGPARSIIQRSAEGKDNQIVGLDLAPYRLFEREDPAIGVRSGLVEGYAGGFGYFESLHLFRRVGTRLEKVFSHPIYLLANSAGSWNEDGTREHVVSERRFSVSVVSKAQQDGSHDLVIKESGTGSLRFVAEWNGTTRQYLVR